MQAVRLLGVLSIAASLLVAKCEIELVDCMLAHSGGR